MSLPKILINIFAFLFLLYSIRSLIAGIRNEKRKYWISIEYDGTKDLLKHNYDRIMNILFGVIGISISIILFVIY